MRYQFFTVRCADPVPDSERLNAFLAAHPILSVVRELLPLLPTPGRPCRPTRGDHAA